MDDADIPVEPDVEPAVEPAVEPDVEPAVEPDVDSAPASTADVEPADGPTAEPEPDATTFRWDEWDGDYSVFPESIQPWAAKLYEVMTEPIRYAQEELERAKQVYEALAEQREDPRVAELQAKLKEYEETDWDSKTRDYEERLQAFQALYDKQAEDAADAFMLEHKWMFDGGPLQARASKLLSDYEFDYKHLPTLLRLPERVQQRACELMKEFGSPKFGDSAIKLATLEFKPEQENATEKLVAGSNGPVNRATSRENVLDRNSSYQDLKMHYIRKAMRN